MRLGTDDWDEGIVAVLLIEMHDDVPDECSDGRADCNFDGGKNELEIALACRV